LPDCVEYKIQFNPVNGLAKFTNGIADKNPPLKYELEIPSLGDEDRRQRAERIYRKKRY
jgi:hypothetical protein